MKDGMKRNTKTAAVLCLAVLGTAIAARADCRQVRGTDRETIIPSPNDPLGRVLGNVDGVLNGASTAVVTSETPDGLNATSSDVFVTNAGDILTATGAVTLTPVPGSSSEFTENATLTITGGSGKYTGASGTITLAGQAVFDSSGGGTFNVTYQGSVCGPNLSMIPEQAGQRRLGGSGGSTAAAMPSSTRQRSSSALRLRLAKSPKCRMRTRPPGRT